MDIIDFVDIFEEIYGNIGIENIMNFFTPVNVTKGRKFKGFGYVTKFDVKGNGGYGYGVGASVYPLKYHTVYTIWNPETKEKSEFNGKSDNGDLHADTDIVLNVPEDKFKADFFNYMIYVVNNAASFCNDFTYLMRYLRKVLHLSDELAEELAKEVDGIRKAENENEPESLNPFHY